MKQPYCCWCGKAIAKYSKHIWVQEEPDLAGPQTRHIYTGKGVFLRSKKDCQRYTNETVLSVSYTTPNNYDGEQTGPRRIGSFSTWDGESYVSPYFCNGEHARLFGYAAARHGLRLKTTVK